MPLVFTLAGLGVGQTNVMNYACNMFASSGGNTPLKINYPAQLDSIPLGVDMLDYQLKTTPGELVVFGWSEGAQVASRWLREHADDDDRPDPERVRFVFVGNPERKLGCRPGMPMGNSTGLTPDDTDYQVTDLARRLDGWANHPRSDNPFNPSVNFWTVFWATIGMFTTHLNYFGTNPTGAGALASQQVNNTTYYLMP